MTAFILGAVIGGSLGVILAGFLAGVKDADRVAELAAVIDDLRRRLAVYEDEQELRAAIDRLLDGER